MTYDPNRIEIASDGVVTRGGARLGVMTFDSLVAQINATGEHAVEGTDPDGELDDALAEAELAEDHAKRAEEELEDAQNTIGEIIKDIKSGSLTKLDFIVKELEAI